MSNQFDRYDLGNQLRNYLEGFDRISAFKSPLEIFQNIMSDGETRDFFDVKTPFILERIKNFGENRDLKTPPP